MHIKADQKKQRYNFERRQKNEKEHVKPFYLCVSFSFNPTPVQRHKILAEEILSFDKLKLDHQLWIAISSFVPC